MQNIAQAFPNSKNDSMKYLKFTPDLITAFAKMRKFALDRAEQSDLEEATYHKGKQVHVLGCDAAMCMEGESRYFFRKRLLPRGGYWVGRKNGIGCFLLNLRVSLYTF